MNLLLTTDAFPPGAGGSGRSTAILAQALSRRGHRVRVVVARSRPLGQNEWKGVEVVEIEIPAARLGNSGQRESAFSSGLRLGSGEEAWDLAHAQHWLSAGATRRALPRLPLVVTVRDYWPTCIWSTMLSGSELCPGCSYSRRVLCTTRRRSWLWPAAPILPPLVGRELARRRQVLDSAAAVVAVSRYVAEQNSLPGARVIPNFVESAAEEIPRPEGLPERYLLFAGKLEPGKAPDRLGAILEQARCDLPVLVAGTGSLEARLGADGKLRLLGWMEEEKLLALLQHAEALVFPSLWPEPLSRVLLDALSLGTVVVAEPTGGTEEILVDGESGLLGRGSAELGRALSRVLEDPSLARRLREGARERARALFSEEAVLPKLEALYRHASGS